MLHTYNPFPVAIKEEHSVYLTDADGNDYLDFEAGIAVFASAMEMKRKRYIKSAGGSADPPPKSYYNVPPLAEAAKKVVKGKQDG